MNGEEKLTEQQLKFVSRELGLTEEEFIKKKENDYDQLIEECAAIEVEETIKAGDGELSQRGSFLWSNTYRKPTV